MCLALITKIYDEPLKKKQKAWKLLHQNQDKKLETPFQYMEVKIGEQYEVKDTWPLPIFPVDGVSELEKGKPLPVYPCGFHVYKTKSEATKAAQLTDYPGANWKVFEVEVEDVVAEGIDGTAYSTAEQRIRNLVALKMKILREVPSDELG